MKKFFRALAVVLTLALVIGTVPASAATSLSLKYSKKTLYVGEARGFKEEADGTKTYSKYLTKVSYAKAVVGINNKAEAAKENITATTSDSKVVKVSDKSRAVTAVGIGTATVTYYADGKKLGTTTYTVKKTASDATVYFGRDLLGKVDGDAVTVNKEYTVSLPRTTTDAAGTVIKNDTDNRELKANSDKVVITKDATADRLWTVKFTEAGDYVLTATAFQSKSYPGITGTKTLKLTAKRPAPVGDPVQTASNAFKFTFEEGYKIDEKEFANKLAQ